MIFSYTAHWPISNLGQFSNSIPIHLPAGRKCYGISIGADSEIEKVWIAPKGKINDESQRQLVSHRRPLMGWPWSGDTIDLEAIVICNTPNTEQLGINQHMRPEGNVPASLDDQSVAYEGFFLRVDMHLDYPPYQMPLERADYQTVASQAVTEVVAFTAWHFPVMGRQQQDIDIFHNGGTGTLTYTIYGTLEFRLAGSQFKLRTQLSTGTLTSGNHAAFHGSDQWDGIEVDLNVNADNASARAFFKAMDY